MLSTWSCVSFYILYLSTLNYWAKLLGTWLVINDGTFQVEKLILNMLLNVRNSSFHKSMPNEREKNVIWPGTQLYSSTVVVESRLKVYSTSSPHGRATASLVFTNMVSFILFYLVLLFVRWFWVRWQLITVVLSSMAVNYSGFEFNHRQLALGKFIIQCSSAITIVRSTVIEIPV